MKQKNRFFLTLIIVLFASFYCEIYGQDKPADIELPSLEIDKETTVKSVVYDIRALGMDVGTISVNQKEHGDEVFVEAISQVEVRIVFKIKVKYIQTSSYENGILQESSLKTFKKEEVNSDTRITKMGDKYKLSKKGEVSYIYDIIRYSGSLLYFNEPTKVKDLYFEISGEKTVVKILEPHKFEIIDPHNGNKNEYSYKNGVLDNAIIKHTMANVYLTKRSNTTENEATK